MQTQVKNYATGCKSYAETPSFQSTYLSSYEAKRTDYENRLEQRKIDALAKKKKKA
jgi:hypothetical protein